MSIRLRKWSQKTLLYPVAIFAIIVPTVIMAVYGTWALKRVELRPATYREELRSVQQALEVELEREVSVLNIPPPAGPADLEPARDRTWAYIEQYNTAIASQAFVGLEGRVRHVVSVADAGSKPVPPVVAKFVSTAGIKPGLSESSVVRRTLTEEIPEKDGVERSVFIAFLDQQSGGSIVWQLKPGKIDLFVQQFVDSYEPENELLSLSLLPIQDLDWRRRPSDRDETVGFFTIHDGLSPLSCVVMRLDTGGPFYKRDALLSNIFVILVVLCVPIVAAASLIVVHWILREATEARKKVDFVSNVSHELKTPLTSIRMFVETLRLGRAKNQDMINGCLDTIMSETNRLGELIDHVLSFSKIENAVKKYNFQPANLAQVVRDTVNLFKAQMTGVEGEVRLKVLPGLPSESVFDRDAIREVILNLLSNAIKYSGAEKFVTVVIGIDRNDLFVEIADRGIGIDPIDQARIFDKFYRVDEQLTRKVDGTGLGLAICQDIVRAHDGRIGLESARGQGSRFTIYLPHKASGGRKDRAATGKVARPSSREVKIPTAD